MRVARVAHLQVGRSRADQAILIGRRRRDQGLAGRAGRDRGLAVCIKHQRLAVDSDHQARDRRHAAGDGVDQDLLAGNRREAGRQHDRHARQLWLHGRVDENVLRRRRLPVRNLQRDDVIARLRRPGRPLEQPRLGIDRGARPAG